MVETDVGDRYVLEAMEQGGWALGGEQSGHIIFRDLATTGDGILTGLQLLDVVVRIGPAAGRAGRRSMTRLPQVLRNVPVADRGAGSTAPTELCGRGRGGGGRAGRRGRVLVRPSGTEPVVRVMVEASTAEAAEAACDVLCQAVHAGPAARDRGPAEAVA